MYISWPNSANAVVSKSSSNCRIFLTCIKDFPFFSSSVNLCFALWPTYIKSWFLKLNSILCYKSRTIMVGLLQWQMRQYKYKNTCILWVPYKQWHNCRLFFYKKSVECQTYLWWYCRCNSITFRWYIRLKHWSWKKRVTLLLKGTSSDMCWCNGHELKSFNIICQSISWHVYTNMYWQSQGFAPEIHEVVTILCVSKMPSSHLETYWLPSWSLHSQAK